MVLAIVSVCTLSITVRGALPFGRSATSLRICILVYSAPDTPSVHTRSSPSWCESVAVSVPASAEYRFCTSKLDLFDDACVAELLGEHASTARTMQSVLVTEWRSHGRNGGLENNSPARSGAFAAVTGD